MARGDQGWAASEIDLSGAADVEEVADLLREVDPEAKVSLLFVEADDEYLAILRLDDGEDLRVFGSDAAFAQESRLGALLLDDLEAPAVDTDFADAAGAAELTAADADGGAAVDTGAGGGSTSRQGEPDIDPVGDPDLLGDLGVGADRLLGLCAHEGMLPSDVTAEVCQRIGCGDEVEELREA